jgi:hypothetical protein
VTVQRYNFKSKVWLWQGGKAAWHFVSMSEELSQEIRIVNADRKKGWGSIPVVATIGKTQWRTSVFPYNGSYLLPLKAEVRKKEKIVEDVTVKVTLDIGA